MASKKKAVQEGSEEISLEGVDFTERVKMSATENAKYHKGEFECSEVVARKLEVSGQAVRVED